MTQTMRERLIIKAAEILMPAYEVEGGAVGSFDGEKISYIDYGPVNVADLIDGLLTELKPSAWRVQDATGEWTFFDVEAEARQEAEVAGNLEALAVIPDTSGHP